MDNLNVTVKAIKIPEENSREVNCYLGLRKDLLVITQKVSVINEKFH